MKMSFAPSGHTRPIVAPEQIAMRAARPRRLPVLRILIIAVVVALIGMGCYLLLGRSRISSYGVVASGVEMFHAPVRSRVVSVHVEPGDRVAADTVLCVLVSDDSQAELKEAQEALTQQRGILDTVVAQQKASFEDPAEELRDLEGARAKFQESSRHLEQVLAAIHDDDVRLRQDEERLTRELRFDERALADATRHLQQVRDLRLVEAALPSEEEAAARVEREAAFARAGARQQLDTLAANREILAKRHQGDEAAARDALALESAYVDKLTLLYRHTHEEMENARVQGIKNIGSRILGLEARVANLKKLAGPTEVRSLADGVVTEVLVTDGSNVAKDAELMSVSGTAKLWINAFVPPDRARDVHLNALATVYPSTGVPALAGKVTAGGGIQYKVHPSLRDRIGRSELQRSTSASTSMMPGPTSSPAMWSR